MLHPCDAMSMISLGGGQDPCLPHWLVIHRKGDVDVVTSVPSLLAATLFASVNNDIDKVGPRVPPCLSPLLRVTQA